MQKIHPLSPHIIAKIAAGEVIERPVFAVKELLENAIDADADTISIHIEDSGLKKIIITDNGEGMSSVDLEASFKPHTTSKITHEEELSQIRTLGFRGEALSSISAMSDMVLQSRIAKEPTGTEIRLQAGSVKKMRPVGMPIGTRITVDNLFYTVPARKKFLKSRRTELRHITDLLIHYSLSFPEIRFTLSHNGRTLLDVPKSQALSSRMGDLFGTIFQHMVPLTFSDTYIQMQGFLASPQTVTRQQSKQFIFVNKRKVSDRLISLAVKEAYGTLLEQASYPVFVLFLTMPFETVDVNVHPRKEQVSFLNGKSIFEAVYRAVTETLLKNNMTFHSISWSRDNKGTTLSFGGKVLKETVKPWEMKNLTPLPSSDISQFHNVYLATETKDGLMLIDQHAAHERILYQQYEKAFSKEKRKTTSVILKEPYVLHLSLSDAQSLADHMKAFTKLGFVIQKTDHMTYVVTKVPLIFQDRDMGNLIPEFLEMMTSDVPMRIDTKSKTMIAFLACRAAVKAGDRLTKIQAKELLQKLEKTENNATCPHGRPTKIAVSMEELDRLFKRS